jgi:hypothetical protein
MTPMVRTSIAILVTALLSPVTDSLAQVPPQITRDIFSSPARP